MKIIILDSLIKQFDSNSVPTDVMPRIFSEFQRLAYLEKDGKNSVEEYIKNHHGIKMKGVDKIFKYELTDGDRILYAYSSDLPWLNSRGVEDAIVLLRYSKHDDQGGEARKFDLKKERGYTYIKEDVEKLRDSEIAAVNNSSISIEDYVAVAEILNSDDYTEWHKVYVIKDDQDYSSLTLDEMDIFLSNEQDECISDFRANPSPTLIIGGAGTGKTLIAVHLLINHARNNSQKKAFYFTQSRELRKKVNALFDQYSEGVDAETVEFIDINEYCINHLGLKDSSIVYTREFIAFVESEPRILELCQKNDLSPIDVWTEIRGIIKGGMSAEWARAGSMSQQEFNGSINTLIDRGYFIRTEEDKKRIRLACGTVADTRRKMSKDEDLKDIEKENLTLAMKHFSEFDPDVRYILKDEYIDISDELSSVEKNKRAVVWEIFIQYDKYRISNSLYDENDIARMMFKNNIHAESKCSFSVVDEVQDYSELQLFLIKTLTEGNHIVFAGDEHQNINPASFSESRIKSLFYKEKNTDLRIKRLKKNFRCQQGIIDITNALAGIRRTVIGSGSAVKEEAEIGIRKSDAIPNRLFFNEDNLTACIRELMPYPKAVFLVPDQSTYEFLMDKINQLKDSIIDRIGEDKFNARLKSAVFTVAEIKGVEYEYVVCFDLIGKNINVWQTILEGVRHQTKYRYYFNLLYVAMTRAQEFLCLIDTHISEDLDRQIGIRNIDSFDAKKLFFDRLSASETDYYEQAQEYERNGKYREAAEYYRIADAGSTNINRCNYYIAVEEKDYDAAIVNAIALDSPELIDAYWDEVKDPDLKRFAEAYTVLKKDPINYELRQTNLSMLTQSIIPDALQKDVRSVILQTLKDALQKHKKELKATTENRRGLIDPGVLKTNTDNIVQADKRAVEKDYTKPEEAFSEDELLLFRRIENLRCRIAEELGIDDYKVVTYMTMIDMTLKMPATREEFIKVEGIRNRELEQFGDRFIDEIRKYKKESNKEATYKKHKQSGSQEGRSRERTADELSKEVKTVTTQVSQPLKGEQIVVQVKEESTKRSCYNCKLYRRGDCSGLKGLCGDYEYAPTISKEELDSWPTEMGPYVTGYGSRRKR